MAKVPYASVVGCSMNVIVCIMSDLTQVVSQVFKFMSKSEKRHSEAVKSIFRYLNDFMNYGIMFRRE